jgi:glutathione synthase/RimK-type ligase-like ATP-grasp enzyme
MGKGKYSDVGLVYSRSSFQDDMLRGVANPELVDRVLSGEIAVLNSAFTPLLVTFKEEVYWLLSKAGVPVPITHINLPMSALAVKMGLQPEIIGLYGPGVHTEYSCTHEAVCDHRKILAAFKPSPIVLEKRGWIHNGEGVNVIPHRDGFIGQRGLFQEFLIPPFEDGYMRDIRVLMLGGEPFCMEARRARRKLLRNGRLRSLPPEPGMYLANISQGGKSEEVPESLQGVCVSAAKRALEALVSAADELARSAHQTRAVRFLEQRQYMGFCSVDLLFDMNWQPRVVEIHSCPATEGFFKEKPDAGRTYWDYISTLAREKLVFVPGDSAQSSIDREILLKAGIAIKIIPRE